MGVTGHYVVCDAGDPLDAMAEIDHGITSVDIACYLEGHRKISDKHLDEAVLHKQAQADDMMRQVCFEARSLLGWLPRRRPPRYAAAAHRGGRAHGQPEAGRAVVADCAGSSLRYLSEQNGVSATSSSGGTISRRSCSTRRATPWLSDQLNNTGIHLFPFNQIDETVNRQQLAGRAHSPGAVRRLTRRRGDRPDE